MEIDKVDITDGFDFSVTNCDVADIITEINRFLFHIFLIHIITHTIDGNTNRGGQNKDELFGSQLFKTMFITAIAVLTYHIIFKKMVNTKLKTLQSTCKRLPLENKENDTNKTNGIIRT